MWGGPLCGGPPYVGGPLMWGALGPGPLGPCLKMALSFVFGLKSQNQNILVGHNL